MVFTIVSLVNVSNQNVRPAGDQNKTEYKTEHHGVNSSAVKFN
jgi:hypothetical protein